MTNNRLGVNVKGISCCTFGSATQITDLREKEKSQRMAGTVLSF